MRCKTMNELILRKEKVDWLKIIELVNNNPLIIEEFEMIKEDLE